MSYILICIIALLGSALTLFSGFGLGTLLLPVFGIFFPIELAIAMTAVVHFLNNLFKLGLVGRHADKDVVFRFGLPAVVAAFAGAYLLSGLTHLDPVATWTSGENLFSVTPLKLVIGFLLAFFALFDLVPSFGRIQFDRRYLPVGGLLSGFFGGLSGNQGALRSAFLIKAGLSKEAFIGSGVLIACLIDISRLSIYADRIFLAGDAFDVQLVTAATLSAFAGAWLGNKWMKKVTIGFLQKLVGGMLMVFAVLLAAGVI